jgi:hypothetical protein
VESPIVNDRHWHLGLLWIAPVIVACAGCGSSVVEKAEAPVNLDQSAEARPEDAAKVSEIPEEAAEFEPPFADRNEIFLPPSETIVEDNPRRGGFRPLSLRGFVDVDGLQALIEMDGEINEVHEGDILSGIQVVRIAPPSVTLRRGQQEWNETFSQPEVSQGKLSERSGGD